jgi:uncharacterized protein YjlB
MTIDPGHGGDCIFDVNSTGWLWIRARGHTETTGHPEPLAVRFGDDGSIPNNPLLAVLIYRGAFQAAGSGPAAAAERLFNKNEWPPQWRDGIYDFHHYHSTAHEALAIARGAAKVRLGGESGQDFDLEAGDIAVLPAGTGHRRLSAAGDLLVIGAYPPGQRWDLLRGTPGERPDALGNIQGVPLPKSDPVFGRDGPLTRLWR